MKVQLSNYNVEIKESIGWGETEIIKAEMMSAMRLSAEQRQQVNTAAAEADANGVPVGEDPFKLSGIAMDGTAVLAARVKAAELIITKIETIVDSGEPEVIKFSQAWLYKLSKTDGNKLMAHVDDIRRKADVGEDLDADIEGK